LALDSPMAITCLAERAPCLPSRTCSISWRTYSPACADGDWAFRAGRVVFFFGKATVHRRRAAFSLSLFPIGSDAVVPGHFRSPGGIGHIGPTAFVKTRSVLQFCLVHVEDEALLVLVHLERTPRHREQLVSHAQNSAEGQHRVGYPAGWDVDHEFIESAKVLTRRVPHAVASQCAGRQDAPILLVGICLLDLFLLHRIAPLSSCSVAPLRPIELRVRSGAVRYVRRAGKTICRGVYIHKPAPRCPGCRGLSTRRAIFARWILPPSQDALSESAVPRRPVAGISVLCALASFGIRGLAGRTAARTAKRSPRSVKLAPNGAPGDRSPALPRHLRKSNG